MKHLALPVSDQERSRRFYETYFGFGARPACRYDDGVQKLSGGGGTVNVRMRSAAIRILEGRDLIQTYQPPEGSSKTFCLACGSNLFGGGWPDSEYCSVRVTTLDEPVGPLPSAHIYVRSLAEWEELPDDGAERLETPPGSRPT